MLRKVSVVLMFQLIRFYLRHKSISTHFAKIISHEKDYLDI